MPSVDRPWGVFLCVLSFSGGALTDMLKRKLFGIGLAPTEIVLSWNCCDACILLVGSLLFDPLPLQTLADLGPSFWKPLLGSATLCVIGSVLHATAIKKGGLSSVPFLSFNPAFSLLISSLVNGEMPAAQGIGGVVVLTAGALALSYDNAKAGSAPADARAGAEGEQLAAGADELAALLADAESDGPRRARAHGKPHGASARPSARDTREAAALMSLGGLCWASSSSLEKLGLGADERVHAQHFLCAQKALMALPLLAHFCMRHPASRAAKRAKPLACARRPVLALLILSAGLDTFTVLTYLMSLRWIYVSFSLALKRAGGIFLAVLGGMLVFGEAVSSTAWGAIFVMVAGVIMVVTS